MNIFIDLGAHDGNSVELFLKNYKDADSFSIHSFEPNPYLVKKYKQSYPLFNIYQKAASNKNGTAKFYLGNPLSSTLRTDKTTGDICYEKPINVEIINLSQFILENFSKSDFIIIKMDIEGSEYDVIPKLLEDGLFDGYINLLYGEWHLNKIQNIDLAFHEKLVSLLKDKGFVMKEWCAEKGFFES